jgi:spore maturation protein A
MLNYLWGFMIVLGVTIGVITGRIGDVSKATINSSKEAVALCITMLGIMAMWTGIMQVAKKCGLVAAFTRALRPVIRFLYPDIPKDHIVNEHIAANMIANILGLGWAATPMGLMAMKELKELNHNSEVASCDMCTLLIVNISSLQLIPVNIIAYRSQYGSVNPAEILGAGLVATICSTCVGVTFSVIARKVSSRAGKIGKGR